MPGCDFLFVLVVVVRFQLIRDSWYSHLVFTKNKNCWMQESKKKAKYNCLHVDLLVISEKVCKYCAAFTHMVFGERTGWFFMLLNRIAQWKNQVEIRTLHKILKPGCFDIFDVFCFPLILHLHFWGIVLYPSPYCCGKDPMCSFICSCVWRCQYTVYNITCPVLQSRRHSFPCALQQRVATLLLRLPAQSRMATNKRPLEDTSPRARHERH